MFRKSFRVKLKVSDTKKTIENEMAAGHYEDEHSLVTEALEVFRELKQRHAELNQQIHQSLAEEKAGRVAAFDINEIISELESVSK